MEEETDSGAEGGLVSNEAYDFTPTEDNPLLPVTEVARLLSVKTWTVKNWINTGKIRATKVVGQWRIPKAEVSRIVNETWGE